MSGIYIPSMGMPKGRPVCIIIDPAGQVRRYDLNNDRYADDELFEAISVPSHGRTIDVDALEYEEAYLNGHYELGDVEIVTRKDIESAPTIIPADKEED